MADSEFWWMAESRPRNTGDYGSDVGAQPAAPARFDSIVAEGDDFKFHCDSTQDECRAGAIHANRPLKVMRAPKGNWPVPRADKRRIPFAPTASPKIRLPG